MCVTPREWGRLFHERVSAMESTTYWMRLAAASAAAERRRAEELSDANDAKLDSKEAEDPEDANDDRELGTGPGVADPDAKDAAGHVLALCCARCSSALATKADLLIGPRPAQLPPTVWAFDFETLETDVDAFCATASGTDEPVARFDFIRCATRSVAVRCAPTDCASVPSAWFSGLACSRLSCRCGADLGWTYHRHAAAPALGAPPKEDEARVACAAKESAEEPDSAAPFVHPWYKGAESKADEAKMGDRPAAAGSSLSTFGEDFTALLTSAVREKTLPPSHLIAETAPVVRRWNRRNAGRVVRSTSDGCQSRQRMLDTLGQAGTSSPSAEGDPLRVLRQLQLQHGAGGAELQPKAEAK